MLPTTEDNIQLAIKMTGNKKTGNNIKLRGKSFRKRKEGQVRLHCCCAMCSSGWTEFLSRKKNDDEHAKERGQQTVATKYCEKKKVLEKERRSGQMSVCCSAEENSCSGKLQWIGGRGEIHITRTGVNWWQLKIYLFWNLLLISGLCCRHRSLICQKTDWLKQILKDGAWKTEFFFLFHHTLHFLLAGQVLENLNRIFV